MGGDEGGISTRKGRAGTREAINEEGRGKEVWTYQKVGSILVVSYEGGHF